VHRPYVRFIPLVTEKSTISLRQWDLAVSHRLVGDVLQAGGDLAGAQKEYRTSIPIMTEVVKKEPSNAMWRRDLAAIHALSVKRSSRQETALGRLTAHAGLAQITAVTNDPSPDETPQELAGIQRRISEALRTRGALAADREAVRS
jgi:hypothetical protein